MNEAEIRRKIEAHARSFGSIDAAWRKYSGGSDTLGEKAVKRFLKDAGVPVNNILVGGVILGKVMAKIDANRDGRVTKAELTPFLQ